MVAWFPQRAGAVQHLILKGKAAEPRLSTALTVAIIATQCSSLRTLEISLPACGVSGSDLGVLSACTQLTLLTVEQNRGSSWSDHSVGLFRSIRHMPALQELRQGNLVDVPAAALPGLDHFTALQSATLSRLFSTVIVEGGSLQLAGLPVLRDLELLNPTFQHGVESLDAPNFLPASSFTAVSGLTRLSLRSCLTGTEATPQLHLDSLRPLTALQELTVLNCGLAENPAALAAVGQTLRALDVRRGPLGRCGQPCTSGRQPATTR